MRAIPVPFWCGNWWRAAESQDGGTSRGRSASRAGARESLERAEASDRRTHALVGRVRHGDQSAFDELYLTHFDALWRFAYRYTRSGDAASDVVQDVFTDLWMRRAEWAPRTSIDAYLFRAIRNRVISARRHAETVDRVTWSGVANDSGPSEDDGPARRTEHDDAMAQLRTAIDRLTERQRAAVLLRWEHELNSVETAAVLGVSEAAVRKLLRHAAEQLRPVIETFRAG